MYFDVFDFLEVFGKCFFGNWFFDNLKYSKILVVFFKRV